MRNLVYKVVHTVSCGTERVSAFCNVPGTKARTEYPVGKEVTPKIGKVFAFSSLKDANSFAEVLATSPWEIWQAKATGVSRPNFPLFVGDRQVIEVRNFLELFWSREFDKLSEEYCGYFHCSPLKGTVICSSIKLLRQLA